MGFETLPKLLKVQNCIIIWTLSLWDLKQSNHATIHQWETFELCPYGIWNIEDDESLRKRILFELCPYGIWNLQSGHLIGRLFLIWTLSLWDLKLEKSELVYTKLLFELCPYGIWNCVYVSCYFGSRTFELCPYGIWNVPVVLFDLALVYLNFVPMGFETWIFEIQL